MQKYKFKKFKIVASIFLAFTFTFTPLLQAKAFGPVVVVHDIPSDIREGIKSGLESAFTQFASAYLSQLLTKIESNYKIANFLYYSDALVSGQYLQDYLNKYVPNSLDQRMILTFIPQFNCGKNIDISQQLQQNAINYLGFDPKNLSPDDPNFSQKLSRMGDFLASPSGWNAYYQDIAAQTENAAEKAAQEEITSSGIKSPHDANGDIASSVNSIVQSEASGILSSLNLGTEHPDDLVGQMASGLTFTFIKNFAFKGAVFKEQATCLNATQIQPIEPVQNQAYSAPAQNLIQVSPAEVFKGQDVTVSWDATSVPNAVRATLNGKDVALSDATQQTVYANTVFSLAVYDQSGNVLNVFNAGVTVK